VYVELPWRGGPGSPPCGAVGHVLGPGARITARVAAVERAMAQLVSAPSGVGCPRVL